MIRAMSTYVYVKERLHPGLLDGLARAGAQAVEIFAARGHFDYANRKSQVKEIADFFKTSPMKLSSLHSPMYSDYEWGRQGSPPVNIAATNKSDRIAAMDEIKRAIEVAEQIPFKFLVQHVGNSNEEFSEEKFEATLTSIEHLRAFAKPLGVTLLLENIPNELSTPDRLLELVNTLHFDDMGFCFDVGHAHIGAGVQETFEQLKGRIRSTHVHDNDKMNDSHFWPGDGGIDWSETITLLRSAPLVPPILLEINGEGKTEIPKMMSDAFRRLDEAAAAKSA
jgi:sugar phosphate isomerase/epimerase